jgi:hypothetical protein
MKRFRVWNRRAHFYIGLYFLFFTWLFAFSGLILNHSWEFATFYPNRKITTWDARVKTPAMAVGNLAVARDVAGQLGVRGEIALGAAAPVPGRLDFSVSRPGKVYQIQARLSEGSAHVIANQYNAWGIMHVLHTFTGISVTSSNQKRQWIVTTAWALAMDAVAIGLIAMIFSSYYMWWVLPKKRALGSLVLFAGCLSCILFVFGLRWIYS